MENSRRKFLKTVAIGAIGGEVLAGVPGAFAKQKSPETGIEIQKGYVVFNEKTQKNMEKLAEELVPGAGSIGMKEKLMNFFRRDKGVATFFDAGFWNLESISKAAFKKSFYELENKEEIEKVMKHVSFRNRPFFNQFRTLVIKFYYGDPAVWKKLAYDGPPQPRGFMDYSEPPKIGKKK